MKRGARYTLNQFWFKSEEECISVTKCFDTGPFSNDLDIDTAYNLLNISAKFETFTTGQS